MFGIYILYCFYGDFYFFLFTLFLQICHECVCVCVCAYVTTLQTDIKQKFAFSFLHFFFISAWLGSLIHKYLPDRLVGQCLPVFFYCLSEIRHPFITEHTQRVDHLCRNEGCHRSAPVFESL